MKLKENNSESKSMRGILKLLIMGVIVVGFYYMPGVIAEKISYWQIKSKRITQKLDEED